MLLINKYKNLNADGLNSKIIFAADQYQGGQQGVVGQVRGFISNTKTF